MVKEPGRRFGPTVAMDRPVLKLFYVPKTRATRVRWAIEELGLPSELVRLDPSKGETKSEAHTTRNPFQHVPVVETAEGPLFESCAICLHLAAGTPLLPAQGTYEHGRVLQWIFAGVTELEGLLGKLAGERRKAEADPGRLGALTKKLERPLQVFDAALSTSEWIAGPRFTVADLIVGALLVWAGRLELLRPLPHAQAYVARITARPAYQRAMAD